MVLQTLGLSFPASKSGRLYSSSLGVAGKLGDWVGEGCLQQGTQPSTQSTQGRELEALSTGGTLSEQCDPQPWDLKAT